MDIVLHIGTPKTGTKTIQRALAMHRPELLAKGTLYPTSLGRFYHWCLTAHALGLQHGQEAMAWAGEQVAPHQVNISDAITEFLAEVDRSNASQLVLSSEHLVSRVFDLSQIARVRALLDQIGSTRIILYLKPIAGFIESSFAEEVKGGRAEAFNLTRIFDTPERFDYLYMLRRWGAVFGCDAIQVRLFDPKAFVDNDLVADFMTAIGLGDLHFPAAGRQENISPDGVGVEILRRLNLASRTSSATDAFTVRRAALPHIIRMNGGRGFRLSPQKRAEIAAHYAPSCAALKLAYPTFDGWDAVMGHNQHEPEPNADTTRDDTEAIIDRCAMMIANLLKDQAQRKSEA